MILPVSSIASYLTTTLIACRCPSRLEQPKCLRSCSQLGTDKDGSFSTWRMTPAPDSLLTATNSTGAAGKRVPLSKMRFPHHKSADERLRVRRDQRRVDVTPEWHAHHTETKPTPGDCGAESERGIEGRRRSSEDPGNPGGDPAVSVTVALASTATET